MKGVTSYQSRFAEALMRLAWWLLPSKRSDWAMAMRSELRSIADDNLAIPWALGCLMAAIRERVTAMILGNLRVSKWVLTLEMALCFVPLTFVWLDVLFGASGVTNLNAEIVQRYFLGSAAGVTALVIMFGVAVLGALGPIGLLFAFRQIALGRGIRHRVASFALIYGTVLLGAVYVGGNVILGGPAQLVSWLGGVLLFIVLPVMGFMHLRYLGRHSPDQALAA